MFSVNVRLDIETLRCRLSLKLFRGSVNSPERVGTVNHIGYYSKCSRSSKANLTDREKAGFYSNSNTVDTHYSSIQEGLKPSVYTKLKGSL